MFDYFYSNENEQYLFLQFPMMLINYENFNLLSNDAKVLYTLLLNRTSLSIKNNWKDEYGRVYIIYTINEITNKLNRSEKKAIKSMKELKDSGLVKTTRRGLNLPNLIYVMNFATDLKYTPKDKKENNTEIPPQNDKEIQKEPENPVEIRNCNLDSSRTVNDTVQELDILQSSNTDYINTVSMKNDLVPESTSCQTNENLQNLPDKKTDNDNDFNINHEKVKEQIYNNIDYDTYLTNNNRKDIALIDELVNCMLDVVCTKEDTVKINGEKKNRNYVISQYMQLSSMDIDHILARYKKQHHKITQLHSYLKTMLYTVRQESNHFYNNQVKSDNSRLVFV